MKKTHLGLITDSHLGQPRKRLGLLKRLVGYHSKQHAKALRNAVSTLQDHAYYDNMVPLHLGDITDRGTKREFEEAKDILSELNGLRCCIGNHDATNTKGQGNGYSLKGHHRALKTVAFLEKKGVTAYPRIEEYADWRLVLLDSTAHNEKGTLFAQGRIGHRQLAFLKTHLALAKPTVVALHHSPMGGNPLLWLSDRKEFIDVTNRPHVMCVFGHLHEFRQFPATDDRCFMLGLDAIYKDHVDPVVINPLKYTRTV